MKFGLLVLVIALTGITLRAQLPNEQPIDKDSVCIAATGEKLLQPGNKRTYEVRDGRAIMQVPLGMVYIPQGEFTFGSGSTSKKAQVESYCIGKFSVTNAEYKVFLDATGSRRAPSYWKCGNYPDGKGNHPVVFVSLVSAQA